MSLVSRYEFQKCVDRYKGDWRTRSFTCFDQFKVMSFAQFTDRSGLRDIEMTLVLCGNDLYHAGLCSVPKSTLAEANEKRNWMIYRDFAQTLIKEAKMLYRDDYFRLGLKEMVYALDSTAIRLYLELSPWVEFHPENSASGGSYIYRYDIAADKLVEPKLMINEPIADAIILKDGDNYRMYATRVPDTNGCMLHEYVSNSLFGPYNHIGEDSFDKNTARMAGMFLTLADGQIIRPAQDCFGDYGKAVIMYDGHVELCRLSPTSYKHAGIHTFNTLGQTFDIDIKKYDFPLLYKLIRAIKG